MLKAKATLKRREDGLPQTVFLFGLSDGNLAQLRAGKEIVFDAEQMGIPGAVCIFHGKTEHELVRFVQQLPTGARPLGDERDAQPDSEPPYLPPEAYVARVAEIQRAFKQDPIEWLITPHRELDERTPLDVIICGSGRVVVDMLEAASAGIPT